MSDKPNDFEEQYLLLEEEEKKENKRKLIFLIIIFILIIIVSIIGATFSYNKYKQHHHPDKDKPTETCTVNCDTDGDEIPDFNIDYENDGKAHFNVSSTGGTKPDFNLMNQDTNNDGKCDLNCDNNGDGWPDFNIDLDGDGIPDLNIKEDGNKLTNIDNDRDGICDVKCNGIMDDVEADDNNNVILTMEYQDDRIFYIGTTKLFTAYNIIPGWKDTIEFKIVNNTSEPCFYKLSWIDVTNTITEENNITYKLSKNNTLVIDETRAPYTATELFDIILIPAKTTYTYKMQLEFKETGVNQNIDLNKMFNATLRAEAIK